MNYVKAKNFLEFFSPFCFGAAFGVILSIFVQCGNNRDRGVAVIEPTRIERIETHTTDAIGAIERTKIAIRDTATHIESSMGTVDELTSGTITHQRFIADGSDRVTRIAQRNDRVIEIIRTAGQRSKTVEMDILR